MSFTATGITATTGPSFTGELSIVYRVQDATKDPSREVQGRVTVIVRDVPDAPAQPSAVARDRAATVQWSAPATNNSPITGYTVTWTGGSRTFGVNAAGSPQTIDGLSNGTAYRFTVTATNKIGNSAASPPSAAVTPVRRADRSVVRESLGLGRRVGLDEHDVGRIVGQRQRDQALPVAVHAQQFGQTARLPRSRGPPAARSARRTASTCERATTPGAVRGSNPTRRHRRSRRRR